MSDIITEKTEKKLLSLDEFLAMSREARLEIIDGVTVEMVAAGTHQLIGGNIYRVLDAHNQANGLGVLFYDGMIFLMFSIEKRLKNSYIPDIAFILTQNILDTWNVDKPYPGVPDLAIEIVSPDDSPIDVMRKRRTYLEKGTQELLILYPDLEEVHQYTQQGVKIYSKPEEAVEMAIFPGLSGLTLEVIFKLPDWAIKLRAKNSE